MAAGMNDYDEIAAFYDIEHQHFAEDLDVYLNFAELSGNPVLELACGSGRVLLPLAEAGFEVTGVDSSAKMLSLAEQRLRLAGMANRCKLVQQDICSLQLNQKFRLAFIALGSFAHVITRKEQQQALRAIRNSLVTGGQFILDISNADARYMEHLSGQVLHQGTWQEENGAFVSHFVSPASSTKQHLLELTHFYDVHKQDEAVRRTISKTQLYLFECAEMELLLEQAGFVVKDVYGDFHLGAFELESPRMLFLAEAR
ncbi:MAG TPA: class I SAM-dependent methyltransferase [Ktedonobacteraceae bacterium]|nr:class I SAM-dependent methyltransferase [Ktedonobacteraceae bacterium]